MTREDVVKQIQGLNIQVLGFNKAGDIYLVDNLLMISDISFPWYGYEANISVNNDLCNFESKFKILKEKINNIDFKKTTEILPKFNPLFKLLYAYREVDLVKHNDDVFEKKEGAAYYTKLDLFDLSSVKDTKQKIEKIKMDTMDSIKVKITGNDENGNIYLIDDFLIIKNIKNYHKENNNHLNDFIILDKENFYQKYKDLSNKLSLKVLEETSKSKFSILDKIFLDLITFLKMYEFRKDIEKWHNGYKKQLKTYASNKFIKDNFKANINEKEFFKECKELGELATKILESEEANRCNELLDRIFMLKKSYEIISFECLDNLDSVNIKAKLFIFNIIHSDKNINLKKLLLMNFFNKWAMSKNETFNAVIKEFRKSLKAYGFKK